MKKLNATEIKKIAKELKIKNWWNKKRDDLVQEIAIEKDWGNETTETIEFLLSGGKITKCEDSPNPVPVHTRQDQAYKVTEKPMKNARKRPAKKVNKKTDKKPAQKKTDGLVTLAEICTELSVEPRIARRKLRSSDLTKPEAGWAWDKKSPDLKAVRKLLK